MAAEHLAELQADAGFWNNVLLFYQALNAPAHLDLHQAQIQLERAFKRLFENQNSDGTWSDSEPEWDTFLAIHALKNSENPGVAPQRLRFCPSAPSQSSRAFALGLSHYWAEERFRV